MTLKIYMTVCLQVYEHHNYDGESSKFGHYGGHGQITVTGLDGSWNDKITSYICRCKHYIK